MDEQDKELDNQTKTPENVPAPPVDDRPMAERLNDDRPAALPRPIRYRRGRSSGGRSRSAN